MKKQNMDDVIMHEYPRGVIFRPKRRGHRMINFNERSPEVAAMNAHLRASAYNHQRDNTQRVLAVAGGGSVTE